MADYGIGSANQFGQHNDDVFYSALQNLAGNMQKHRIGSAIEDANQRVQDIRSQMQPGAEQRAALSNTAQEVFLNMTSMGADPAAAAMVYTNLTPKTYNTIDQALLSGDPYEKQAASQIQSEQELRQARMEQQKWDHQMKMTDVLEQGRDRRAELANDRAMNRAAKTPNAGNLKAAGYASQLVQSNRTFETTDKGLQGTSALESKFNSIVPGVFQSQNYQKAQQAKLEFINAIARPESGAKIGEEELANYNRMYFPQPGENSPAILRQKAAARQQAIQKTLLEAGPSANDIVGSMPGGPSTMGTNLVDLSQPSPQFNLAPTKYATPPRRR